MRPHPDATDSSSLILHPCRAVYHRWGIDSVAALHYGAACLQVATAFCPGAVSHVDKVRWGNMRKFCPMRTHGVYTLNVQSVSDLEHIFKSRLRHSVQVNENTCCY